jgi:hypothetical protein
MTIVSASTASAQHTAPAGATSSGTAVPSGGSSSGGSSSGGSSSSTPSSGGSNDGGGVATRSFSSGRNDNGGGHRRGSIPATGTAVPRQPGGSITMGTGGFYPWGYAYGGGLGLGIYDSFYGGYYGAYDPWYGWSPVYAPSASGSDESGAIRLKVKPPDASVYIDGYYVGIVDDFDGAFQRLRLEPGAHRLEIRSQSYRPLSVDVLIQEDLTITYRGELTRQ